MREIWNEEYQKWLISILKFKKKCYHSLLTQLHNISFYSVIPMDENRAEDGVYLRLQFYDEYDEDVIFADDCSVLEMLVALSIRIDSEYVGNPNDPHPEEIFWEMIDNLGLTKFNDYTYNRCKPMVEQEVEHIIYVWLDRDYNKNGEGGIFPLRKTDSDQRDIELWCQMQAYIGENY